MWASGLTKQLIHVFTGNRTNGVILRSSGRKLLNCILVSPFDEYDPQESLRQRCALVELSPFLNSTREERLFCVSYLAS